MMQASIMEERVTHRDVKARESVDPVVQKYRQIKGKVSLEEKKRLEISQDLAIRRAATRSQSCKAPYNVLTHELKPLCTDLPVKKFEKVRTPERLTTY